MTVWVGFLRAVNLGRRRVPMARLRSVCEDLGYTGVWTFVNSGNVVFDAADTRVSVERALEEALQTELGFECTTFARSAVELERVVAAQPFPLSAGDTHFVTFLKQAPPAPARRALEALSNDMDTLVVRGADVHWRMHGRSTDSTLVGRDWERILGPLSSTSRNITMLTRLSARIAATVR